MSCTRAAASALRCEEMSLAWVMVLVIDEDGRCAGLVLVGPAGVSGPWSLVDCREGEGVAFVFPSDLRVGDVFTRTENVEIRVRSEAGILVEVLWSWLGLY
jgi:hypothetical protein